MNRLRPSRIGYRLSRACLAGIGREGSSQVEEFGSLGRHGRKKERWRDWQGARSEENSTVEWRVMTDLVSGEGHGCWTKAISAIEGSNQE